MDRSLAKVRSGLSVDVQKRIAVRVAELMAELHVSDLDGKSQKPVQSTS